MDFKSVYFLDRKRNIIRGNPPRQDKEKYKQARNAAKLYNIYPSQTR